MENLKIDEMISLINKPSKEEVKEFLTDLIEKQGFTGALKEIKGGRNCRENALYAINTTCNNLIAKRFDPVTMETVYQAAEEKIKEVENFKTELTELAKYAFEENNEKQKAYLKLKNEFGNAMFKLAQAYAKLDTMEVDEEYIKFSEEVVDPLQKKLNEAENKLDLYTLEFLK